ncbi:MAG: DUF2244 domain-containing protein [Piscinibacter sp.]|nr:DUF2244 domain-containing protein [Piscinibacter sp.]
MTGGSSTVPVAGAADAGAAAEPTCWVLRRNCSMAPRLVLRLYLALSGVCLSIGTMFWWMGATLVMPFAWLEVLALGVALLVYARHAADAEHIRLEGGLLIVECETGGRTERVDFRPGGVRIGTGPAHGTLIELSGQGRRVVVGRFVRPELRRQLADELRRAVRRESQGPGLAGWVGTTLT